MEITDKEKIAQLENQLRQVVEAYDILEEYTSQLVGSAEENETLTYTNSIVTTALHIDNN